MCRGQFECALCYPRSIGNSLLLIESIAIISILFQNFNPDYNTLSCGCPWAALFTILLANIIIVSNWQDWAVINNLKIYIDNIPLLNTSYTSSFSKLYTKIRNCPHKSVLRNLDYYQDRPFLEKIFKAEITKRNDKIKQYCDKIKQYCDNIDKQYNSRGCSLLLCCLASSTGTIYVLNICLRIWTFALWVMFGKESSCYSQNIFNLLVSTSSVFLLVVSCVVVYGIVRFFQWCVPSCAQYQRDLKKKRAKLEQERQQKQIEYEKTVNLDRVQELELQMKETKHQLEETKTQLDETKRELCSNPIPVAKVIIVKKKEEIVED